MSSMWIEFDGGRKDYRPGESIRGRVTWQLDRAPESAELRLFWYTRGKGTEDVETIDSVSFPVPQTNDDRSFTVTLPRQPYSFSGQLISLAWALELIVEPRSQVERREIVMSPTGREVVLG